MLWEWLAIELAENYHTHTTGKKLQEDYLRIIKEEERVLADQNGSSYPEIQIEKVWNRLLDGECTVADTQRMWKTCL